MKLTDDLMKHGGMMFLATSLASIFNLLYQLYMVRNLSPVDYGTLNSLIALLVVISVPARTLQTAITRFTSSFHACDQWEKIRAFLSSFAKKVLLFGLSFFLIIALASRYISSFFQIPSFLPVVMVGVLMLLRVILPLTLGGLRGLQMFGWLGLSGIMGAGLKLAFGVLLVSLGFRVMGALSAFMVANFAILLLSFFQLRRFILEKSRLSVPPVETANPGNCADDINFPEVYRYFFPVAITLLCFMGLINGDIILVKHFFPPLEAGYYSVAQMAGKIIIFLPTAIVIVMFPKVSNLHAQGKDTLGILKKSLAIVGLLCGIGALICILFPSLIIRLLSGKEYLECIPLVWLFAVAMTFFALLYTLLFYQLSIRRLNFIYPLILFSALQIILITIFHRSLSQVLYILCVNSVILFFVNMKLIFDFKVIGK